MRGAFVRRPGAEGNLLLLKVPRSPSPQFTPCLYQGQSRMASTYLHDACSVPQVRSGYERRTSLCL